MKQKEDQQYHIDAEPCFFTGLLLGNILSRSSGGPRIQGSPGATIYGGHGPVYPGRRIGPVYPGRRPRPGYMGMGTMFASPGFSGAMTPGVGPVGVRPGPAYRTTRVYHY